MRRFASFLAAMILFASVAVPTRSAPIQSTKSDAVRSEKQTLSTELPLDYLLDSAAKDFREHQSPAPTKFRNVRVGHMGAGGEKRYMMCGEVLSKAKDSDEKWMPFVTIRTSGYEQYLGGQGANFCAKSKFHLDKKEDLSAELQKRYEAAK